jgi:hypothetical protein
MSKCSIVTLKVLTGLLLITSVFAEDQNTENPAKTEDHVKPGTRMMPHADWVRIQEDREKQAEEGQEEVLAPAAEESTPALESPQGAFKASSYATSHMGTFYNPVFVSFLGDQLQLHDGSIWSIYYNDAYKTLNWITSDLLVITPNHEMFSSYLFKITNQQTGVTVKCNMQLGPIYNGLYTYWIYSINYFTQELILNDGSVWDISSFDSSIFDKWIVGDTIMMGINDGFLSSFNPNILINVNMLNWVRARCYY